MDPSRPSAAEDGLPPGGALQFILGDEPREHFLNEVLGSRCLHCRSSDPNRFAEHLSLQNLDSVLGSYGLRRRDIRLVQFERDIPFSQYSWRDELVDPLRVARLFSEGATVVFEGLQQRQEPLRRLCARLCREAGVRTQTNIYLTPPGSQGFRPHWDTHDVFVLQVCGSKRWHFYEGGPDAPLPHQKFDPDQHKPGAHEDELTLNSGEALYIPRGQMHSAETSDEISLHITLGLMTYSWADLLADCLMEIAERSPRWRKNVPFGFGADADAGFANTRARFAQLMSEFPNEIALETVLNARLDLVGGAQRPRSDNYLRQAVQAAGLDESHVIECRPDLAFRLESDNDRVLIYSGRRKVDLPSAARPTLEAVLGQGPRRAGEIDDGLDWPSRRVVLTTLIREGFVVNNGADPAQP